MLRLIACLGLLLIAEVSLADNSFGIPEPDHADKPGTVLLHGGGRISGEVFDRFIELAGGRAARIVLVPTAGFDTRDYKSRAEFDAAVRSRYSSWVALKTNGRIADFKILHTEDPDDADKAAFVAPLTKATGVWFTGGQQGRLNYRYVGGDKDSLYQTELKKVLRRGGAVGGTSAGTAAIPGIMTIYGEQEAAGRPLTAHVAHGLGLLDRVVVEQHFDTRAGRFERFLGLLKDNELLERWSPPETVGESMLGLAVDEPAAVELSGSTLRVWGPGHAHLFVKRDHGRTVEWYDVEPDETVDVKFIVKTDAYQVVRTSD